jgi:gliding-associated putative ABC transporter substrate-binding component GldG
MDRFFVRIDLTGDKRYTLSKATKDIIRNLDEPVTVTAYFTDDLPQQFAKIKRDFMDLLVEYNNVSKGKVVYEFINPNETQEAEMKAMKQGIQPVLINAREKDQVKQQKAYLGAIVQMGEQKEVIPFMQQGSAMEYALSTSIKKMTVKDKPLIGFLQGHGEPSLSAMQQVNTSLAVLYNVEPVTLSDTANNLNKFKTVAIVAPVDSFPQNHLRQLDEYLAQGGSLLISIKRVTGNLNELSGSAVNTGLEKWLSDKGCTIDPNFVIDASCASVSMRQSQGMFTYTSNVRFPFLPVITKFAKHPAVSGLEAVILPFASSIAFSGNASMNFIPLAFTSEKSGTQPAPVYFDVMKRWSDADFPLSSIPVAGILTGSLLGNANARILIIADGDFAVNGEGQQAQQLQGDNVNFMSNSIDWLSDDTGLIELRTKGITARPLDQIDEGKKIFLKYFNFLIPIFLIVGYGVFRMQRNRNIRIKRMEEGYV